MCWTNSIPGRFSLHLPSFGDNVQARRQPPAWLRRLQPVLRDELAPRNEWCILAGRIDWSAAGTRYAACFKSGRGHPAVPLRQAMGALIIQKRMGQKRPRPGGGDSREPVPPVLHRPSVLLSRSSARSSTARRPFSGAAPRRRC